MPLIEPPTAVATAATAALTSAAFSPQSTSPDARVALTVTVSVTSGSPACTFKVQGTLDGTNWSDLLLLPTTTDTAASSNNIATLVTVVYHVAQAHIRKFEAYRFITTTVTTCTYSANFCVVI